MSESLIASGVYHYKLGMRDTLVREKWTIHRSGEKELVQVERDASVFLSNLSSEITLHDGKIIGQDIQWVNKDPRHVQKAAASYRLEGDCLSIRRNSDGKAYEETLHMEKDIVLASLMRITVGIVLKQLLQFPDGSRVLVPNILRADDAPNLLGAHLEHRRAKLLSTEPVQAGEKLYQAKCFSYTGDLYDDEARFWLDKHDVLLRYTWKQKDGMSWDVQLYDYQRASKD